MSLHSTKTEHLNGYAKHRLPQIRTPNKDFAFQCYTERKQNVPILKDPKIDRFATQKKGLVESKFQSLSFAQIHRPLILVMSEGMHFDAPHHSLVPVEVPAEAPAEVPAEAPAAPVEDARRPRGRGRDQRRPRRGAEEAKEWVPVTKIGRLVKAGKINSIEEIYLFSLPIKEPEIVDKLLPDLKEEVMQVFPVQKQTTAGQRTRFKAFVAVGDCNGHVGLGSKCAKEVAGAIKGAILVAKMSIIPVRRGYWGDNVGKVHTVPVKVTGKCGSVRVRLIPAPRGTGIVASPVMKKLLTLAGIDDVYTSSRGHTRTLGNSIKATIAALRKTYSYFTPDFWHNECNDVIPYQKFTDFLSKGAKTY